MLAVIGAVGEAEREAMQHPCHDIEGQERGPLQGPCTTARRQAGEIMRLRQQGAGAAEIARKLGLGGGVDVSGAQRGKPRLRCHVTTTSVPGAEQAVPDAGNDLDSANALPPDQA
jgi:hypothetical protein